MQTRQKNMFFILAFVLLVFSISILNYFVDPYGVFKNKTYMRLYDNNLGETFVFPLMKAYKDDKYDTVFVGSSDCGSMFENSNLGIHKFNILSIGGLSYSNYYDLLSVYLNLHPETKNVVIILSLYTFVSNNDNLEFPLYTGENFNKDEILKFLFSPDATLRSIEKIINLDFNSQIELYDPSNSVIFPKLVSALDNEDENPNSRTLHIKNIINLLESKNIKYTIIIPPYNAVFLAILYENPVYKSRVETLKKFLAYNSNYAYDMSFVNKYTEINILKNNYIYKSYDHPNCFWGAKIYKFLFDKSLSDNSLFIKLDKNNINSVLEKENELIKAYIVNNRKLVDKYTQYTKDPYNKECYPPIEKHYKYNDIPEEYRKEYDYINEKVLERTKNE